jgi:Protein of unknown function (DUF3047)
MSVGLKPSKSLLNLVFKNLVFNLFVSMASLFNIVFIQLPWVLLLSLLGACVSIAPTPTPAPEHGSELVSNPWASASLAETGAKSWAHYRLPGKKPSEFNYQLLDGRAVMVAAANGSASMLRRVVRVEPSELGQLNFSWKLPDLIEYADLSDREFDDSPVRIVLAFEGDRSKFSSKNAMLSDLAQLLTGDALPYATLMYVWCNLCAPETVIKNPRTDRIRKLPLESGPTKLNRWLDYERDIRQDFEKAFGEPPGALTSISIMTDTDNTKSRARAYYGALRLMPKK